MSAADLAADVACIIADGSDVLARSIVAHTEDTRVMTSALRLAVRVRDAAIIAADTAYAARHETDATRRAWLTDLTLDALDLAREFDGELRKLAERM